MKLKKLLPLAAVFLVLAALAVFRMMDREPVDIRERARIADLVPPDVTERDLTRIEIYAGAAPQEAVVLTRSGPDEAWRVDSRFGAPANAVAVEEFITDLLALEGEFRAEAAEDAARAPYGLEEASAFHVAAYGAAEDEPLFRFSTGARHGAQAVFVRRDGDPAVYVADTDLRVEAGVHTAGPDAVPSNSHWLDLQVLALNPEAAERVAITMPDKALVLARETVNDDSGGEGNPGAPAPDAAPQDGLDLPGELGDDVITDPSPLLEEPMEAEYEWGLVEGGPGHPVRETGVDGVLRALAGLRGEDVVDPDEDYGFEEVPFSVEVTLEGAAEPLRVEAARRDASGPGYVRVDAEDGQALVYQVARTQFEQLFPRGADLFEMPALGYDGAAVERVEIVHPEGEAVLARQGGGDWSVETPEAGLPPAESALDSIANALAAWRPADYSDSAEGAGLAEPSRTVAFETEDGASHVLALGDAARSVDGYYARLDDDDRVYVMGRSDYTRVFPEPRNLFQRSLFDFPASEVGSIGVERAEDSFELSRREDSWVLTREGSPADTDDGVAEALAGALAGLQAEDILFGVTELPGDAIAVLRFATLEDEDEFTLEIGAEEDGAHPARLTGLETVVTLGTLDVQDILPASDGLLYRGEAASVDDETAADGVQLTPGPAETAPEDAFSAPELVPEDLGGDYQIEFVEPEEEVIELPAPGADNGS